jgi:transposase InsO family protein
VHDNLVDREFTAPATNVVWLTDITEHATGEGKLYLCAVKDVCSNRIVTATRSDERWVADITEFACRDGKLFLSGIKDLHHQGLPGWSMGERQTTDLVVNALVIALARRTPHGDRTILFEYIEVFYNRQRHQARLGHRTPAETYPASRAA